MQSSHGRSQTKYRITQINKYLSSEYQGLGSKSDELIHSSEINTTLQILHFSEHNMVEQELLHHTINSYLLGSSFCQIKPTEGRYVYFS
jgi:hypothetical protein